MCLYITKPEAKIMQQTHILSPLEIRVAYEILRRKGHKWVPMRAVLYRDSSSIQEIHV